MKRLLRHPLSWIFLLGLGVRFAQLTYHSLWFDEVMSIFWAARPTSEIWRIGLALVQDKHPPLYYLLLHGWIRLVGGSDYAVRSLGAAIGALAVLPVYGIGRRLGGPRAGAWAALLVALNPFLVWYSQEARMFMPALTFALVGLYGAQQIADGAWRTLNHRRPRWVGVFYLLLCIGGLTAALYSYLYSAFLMPVAAAWLLMTRWERRREQGARRDVWLGVLALAAVTLFFLPVAWAAWRVSGAEAVPGQPFVGLLPALTPLLRIYAFGWPAWGAGWMAALVSGVGALALVGCFAFAPACGRRMGGFYLFIWLGGVILIGGFLLGRDSRVFAESRYQIALAPALCLAVGRALNVLWTWRRPAGLIAAALSVAVTTAALPYDWASQNRREAWREAAAFVADHIGPHDAILIQADYVRVAFQRYFSGPQEMFFPFTTKLDDPAQVDAPLAGLAGYDRVWVVQSHHQELDPGNLVLGWFAARYPLVTEVFPSGIAIHAFDQHYRVAELPDGVLPAQDWPSLGGLQPLACQYQPTALSPRDDLFHPPSAWIHVTDYWRIGAPPAAGDLRPRLRMVDAGGQVWGESLARQNDAFGVWPPPRWAPGEIVRASHDVNLNPNTPASVYRLVLDIPGTTGEIGCGQVVIRARH